MEILSNIIKYANKIILSQNIREFKNYLRQKLNKDQTLSQIQKSTLIGNKTKEITDLFKQQGLNNQNYQNKALNFIIQKTKSINNKDQLLRLITQDLIAIIATIKNYDYIVKNMTNQLTNEQRNINNFNTYQDLFTFVNNLEQQRKSLEQLQERRALGLPFNKLYTKGGFSMYQINQQDKQNFQKMFNGETGTISKTSWCVTFKKNGYFQSYKPPFYLIMNSSNTAQALICIHKHEFKDIKNNPYKHNNKAVYDLVFQLFNDNNVSYDDYKGDFGILIKYLSKQKKAECIDCYINNQRFAELFYYIDEGYFPELTQLQKKEVLNICVKNYKITELFYYIKTGNLPELTQQQKQEIIDYYIKNQCFDYLFKRIQNGDFPQLTQLQKKEILNFFVDEKLGYFLFDYIRKGWLPELTQQQKQEFINYYIKTKNTILFDLIKSGDLPKLTQQQKQKIAQQSAYNSMLLSKKLVKISNIIME